MLTASSFNGGCVAVCSVLDMVVAHDSAEAFVLGFVVLTAWQPGLETSVSPVSGVGGG